MNRKCKRRTRTFQNAARRCPSTSGDPINVGLLSRPDGEAGQNKIPVSLPLPAYDRQTRRLELGAFCLVGLTAAALIALAGANAVRFSNNRESIAAALSAPRILVSATTGSETNRAFTNLTAIPAQNAGRPSAMTHRASNPS